MNQHYTSTFGASAAVGLISGFAQSLGAAGLSRGSGDRTVVIAGNVGGATAQATAHSMNRFLNRLPTLTVREGHRVKVYLWKKKKGPNDKGTTNLSPESKAAYRSNDLHVHDLRHEGGSRLLEAGWPVHHVQHMLGHASLQQTSTYLNATLRGLHESMRTTRTANGLQAPCKRTHPRPTT